MITFYFQVELTKPSGHHWTIGLNLEVETYNEALRIFRAWAFGVEAVSSLTPHLVNLSDRPAPDRSYFSMDSAKVICEELTTFINREEPTTFENDDDDDWPF